MACHVDDGDWPPACQPRDGEHEGGEEDEEMLDLGRETEANLGERERSGDREELIIIHVSLSSVGGDRGFR